MINYNCVICKNSFSGWGNNPEPIINMSEGKCCDKCNATVVIPKRLEDLTNTFTN